MNNCLVYLDPFTIVVLCGVIITAFLGGVAVGVRT